MDGSDNRNTIYDVVGYIPLAELDKDMVKRILLKNLKTIWYLEHRNYIKSVSQMATEFYDQAITCGYKDLAEHVRPMPYNSATMLWDERFVKGDLQVRVYCEREKDSETLLHLLIVEEEIISKYYKGSNLFIDRLELKPGSTLDDIANWGNESEKLKDGITNKGIDWAHHEGFIDGKWKAPITKGDLLSELNNS